MRSPESNRAEGLSRCVAGQCVWAPLTDPSLHINAFPWQWDISAWLAYAQRGFILQHTFSSGSAPRGWRYWQIGKHHKATYLRSISDWQRPKNAAALVYAFPHLSNVFPAPGGMVFALTLQIPFPRCQIRYVRIQPSAQFSLLALKFALQSLQIMYILLTQIVHAGLLVYGSR